MRGRRRQWFDGRDRRVGLQIEPLLQAKLQDPDDELIPADAPGVVAKTTNRIDC